MLKVVKRELTVSERCMSEVLGEDRILRIGMIGAGGHATHQIYPSLLSLPVEIVAVCDLDRPKAERNARIFGSNAKVYASHHDMLRSATIDAVVICVGAEQHAQLAIDVMEAGLPVWTEKPPASSAAQAALMAQASHKTGQSCMTGFMKRFAPVYQQARRALDSEDFGSPSLLTITWSFGVPDRNWIDIFFLDFGIHMIDLSRYLFGDVVDVFARERDGIAYAVVLSFANRAVGTLNMTAHRGLDITESIEFTGDYGQCVRVDSSGRLMRYRGNEVVDWYERPLALQDSLKDIGYVGCLEEFVEAVRESRAPRSSIESAYESMRVHDAICVSAAEGRVVTVDEIGPPALTPSEATDIAASAAS